MPEQPTSKDLYIVSKSNDLIYLLSSLDGDIVSIKDFRQLPGFSESEVSESDLHHILHILALLDYVGESPHDGIYQIRKAAKKTMKSKFVRLAQMPPAPPAAPPMGAPPMGAPPMGAPPMGAPPMGSDPMGTPEEEDPVVPGPLDSTDKIFVDSDAMDKLKTPGDIRDIALDIWESYGGLPSGDVNPRAVGLRNKEDEGRQVEEVRQENEGNKDRKWERLPSGQNVSDVIGSLDDLIDGLKKVLPSVVKEMKGGGAAGAPPGGGMPPMAAAKGMMLKMATAVSALREEGLRRHADYVEELILKHVHEFK